jgi:hypothetical protein
LDINPADTGVRHIVDIEEFPARRAGAPNHDIGDARYLRFMNRRISAATTWLYSG